MVSISCGFVHYFLCRKGPFDTLIILTTTVSVNNMYSTSIGVTVPIIWLYMTVVVVVISLSIIVSRIFISLLLVTVDIVYSRMGSNSNVVCSVCRGRTLPACSHIDYRNTFLKLL